jgi:hypothetical protein
LQDGWRMVGRWLEDGIRMVEEMVGGWLKDCCMMLRLARAWLQDGQRWLYDG